MGNPLLNSGLNLENDINYNIYIYNWGIFTCQVWFPEGKCWFPFIALLVSRIIILEIHHQPSFTCSESHLQQSTWWTKDKGGTVAFNQFNPFSVRSVPQEPQKNSGSWNCHCWPRSMCFGSVSWWCSWWLPINVGDIPLHPHWMPNLIKSAWFCWAIWARPGCRNAPSGDNRSQGNGQKMHRNHRLVIHSYWMMRFVGEFRVLVCWASHFFTIESSCLVSKPMLAVGWPTPICSSLNPHVGCPNQTIRGQKTGTSCDLNWNLLK